MSPTFTKVAQEITAKDGVKLRYGFSFIFENDAQEFKESWEQIPPIRVEIVPETDGAEFGGTFYHCYSNMFKSKNPNWDLWMTMYNLFQQVEKE
jgi:hypothetical protein